MDDQTTTSTHPRYDAVKKIVLIPPAGLAAYKKCDICHIFEIGKSSTLMKFKVIRKNNKFKMQIHPTPLDMPTVLKIRSIHNLSSYIDRSIQYQAMETDLSGN
jgi:hypothetical protein